VSELEGLQKNAPAYGSVPKNVRELREKWQEAHSKLSGSAGEYFGKPTEEKFRLWSNDEAVARQAWDEYVSAGGTVTIEVPGDGVFTVHNTKDALAAFAKRVKSEFPSRETPRIEEGLTYKKSAPAAKEVRIKPIDDMFESDKGLGWHSDGHFLVKGEPKIPPRSYKVGKSLGKKDVDQILALANKQKLSPVVNTEFVQTGEIDKVGGLHKAVSDRPIPEIDGYNYSYVRLTGKNGKKVYLNQNFYLHVMKHHPESKMFVTDETNFVAFKDKDGKIVAAIMPIRVPGELDAIREEVFNTPEPVKEQVSAVADVSAPAAPLPRYQMLSGLTNYARASQRASPF